MWKLVFVALVIGNLYKDTLAHGLIYISLKCCLASTGFLKSMNLHVFVHILAVCNKPYHPMTGLLFSRNPSYAVQTLPFPPTHRPLLKSCLPIGWFCHKCLSSQVLVSQQLLTLVPFQENGESDSCLLSAPPGHC